MSIESARELAISAFTSAAGVSFDEAERGFGPIADAFIDATQAAMPCYDENLNDNYRTDYGAGGTFTCYLFTTAPEDAPPNPCPSCKARARLEVKEAV